MIPEIKWENKTLTNSRIELRLLYWTSGSFGGKPQNLSLGRINNTGILSKFTPNLTSNLQHITIKNKAVGIFNLYNTEKNQLNITSRAYDLYQPLILHTNIMGHVIAKDNNYNSHYVINGDIIQSLDNDKMYGFMAYLTNVTIQERLI